MKRSGEKRSRTGSRNSPRVSGSNTVLSTSDQQANTKLKRLHDPLTETAEAPVELKRTGATQDFNDLTTGSSLSESSTESAEQLPVSLSSKQLEFDDQTKVDHPGEQPQHTIQDYYIGLSPKDFQKCIFNINRKVEYSRDKNGKLEDPSRKPETYSGYKNEFIRCDMLSGYESYLKLQRRENKKQISFSIKKFDEFLSCNQSLLEKEPPNFVATVSTLRHLMCAYCEKHRAGWKIYAKQINNIWFLSEGWQNGNDGVRDDTKYAARMFELLMTNNRTIESAKEEAKDFPKQAHVYQVCRAKLNEHHLLYSGEVDCCDNSEHTIELKTKTITEVKFESPKIGEDDKRYYWAQAHLMDNHKVIVGFLHHENKTLILNRTVEELDITKDFKPDARANWTTENCVACLNTICSHFANPFFKDAVTYELVLDTRNSKIVASKSDQDLPLLVKTRLREHQP